MIEHELIVVVSFHGREIKYSYPAVFSSVLELEDENLQERLIRYPVLH